MTSALDPHLPAHASPPQPARTGPMNWLKKIWRGAMIVKNGLALVALLLFFGGLFAVLGSSPNPGEARNGALLLELDGAIVEQPAEVDPLAALTGQVAPVGEIRARDVIRALETAAEDDKIKTVVLDLGLFMGAGQVVLQDIGAALDKVRAAKKPVLTFATAYGDDSWQLAAHASEVWLDPLGDVVLAGPGGSQPYFKGLIDRLGVNVHVYRVGKFKSFVEPYTLTAQSPEAKAASQTLADALLESWRADVSKVRPKANLAEALAHNPPQPGEQLSARALRLGLVDKLGDEIAFGRRVAELAGGDPERKLGDFDHSVLATYLAAHPEPMSGEKIGIVNISGAIVDGHAGAGTAGGSSIVEQIEQAVLVEKVKALVIRVDSPGGSVTASEDIRRALEEVRARKIPVVVSMGNVAASGGYWVSMAADRVFAEPATITGSIGVFAVIPTFEGALGRYGVTSDGVQTTPLSGQPDIIGGTTPATDRYFQTGVEDTYRRFIALVATARKQPEAKIGDVAQGRVWDGGAARQLGLVDAFGSLDEAVADAAKRAGVDAAEVRRVYVDPQPDFLGELLGGLVLAKVDAVPRDPLSMLVRRQRLRLNAGLSDAGRVLAGPAVQARCLACPATISAAPRPVSFLNRIFQ